MNLPMETQLDMPLSEVLGVIQQRIMTRTTYHGIPTLKSPLDFWVYQEIIHALQPDVIVEIGNHCGGSTLALAHQCDLIGRGRVIGLDISHARIHEKTKAHPRVQLIEGDACAMAGHVRAQVPDDACVLVIEDSAHTFDNTLKVLRAFAGLVNVGSYFIVEDSICHHGLAVGPDPGPYEAIEAFIGENADFEIDRSRESFLITWNPKGYLKRVRGE